jgi:transcriptional regulator with XRE-family HTH domain
MVSVGRNIRLMRKIRGFTQAQLAERLGVGKSYISSVENGANISAQNLQKFAQALETDVKIFFEEDLLSLPLAAFRRIPHTPQEEKESEKQEAEAKKRIRRDLNKLIAAIKMIHSENES